jgi:hypothetical protein
MTQQLQQDNHLLVLTLYLSLQNEQTQVVFDLSLAGKSVGRLTATPEEIGLPMTLEAARASDCDPDYFKLPDHVVTAVKTMVAVQKRPENEPLWLCIDYPCGNLPLIPWERLLQPRVGVPVLRLPNLTTQPVAQSQSLDVVICLSLPETRRRKAHDDIINRLMTGIPQDLAPNTNFHLFADQRSEQVLRAFCDNSCQITLYDPKDAPIYGEAFIPQPESSAGTVENPWLVWVLSALKGRSADVVHFLCHGYLGCDKGKLALAQAPQLDVAPNWARLVDAQQLSSFLNRIGAWSVAISSPPGNASPSGLRLLEDQLSRLRPGPVWLHDMDQDRDNGLLNDCYRFLYGAGTVPVPKSAAVSLYCHPLQLKRNKVDNVSRLILEEFTLAEKLSDVLGHCH